MRYFSHTIEDITQMLHTVGVPDLDSLFEAIPEACRRTSPLDLPGPYTEWALTDYMKSLSGRMAVSSDYKVFMGAGCYDHFIPASLTCLLGRSEFTTSYTPYQPEISQGTLQAIFEYQTLTARLLGMDIANASMYDGASALAEALLMAIRITGKKKVALSGGVHPGYRRVVETYFQPGNFEIVWLPLLESGNTDYSSVSSIDDLAAVAVQTPNFFGCIEDFGDVAPLVRSMGALLIASFTEPLSFGIYKNPGEQGADIVCGEGQSLGIPQSFGGPGLGMFACKNEYMRNMPGRIVGETKDLEGGRGFVLTLATREQHIRREKATSNICTNQGLCALTAAIYMASLGGTGFRELSKLNYDKTEYLKREMVRAGFVLPFGASTFNEFTVKFPDGFDRVRDKLIQNKIVAGFPLAQDYPELTNHAVFCVTETSTKKDMDILVMQLTEGFLQL